MTRTSLGGVLINASTVPGKPGGIANYAYQLSRHLVASGTRVDLLAPSHLKDHFAAMPGLRILATPPMPQALRLIFVQLCVPWLARRYALVHSVGNYGLLLRRAPQTIFIHDTYEKVSPERFGRIKRRLLSWLISATGARARAVLTNSDNTRRDIAAHYPHLAAKTRVTLLGAKFPVADAPPAGPRNGFLFVGTLEPGKRIVDVLEAYARIHHDHPSHPLRIVGQEGWGTSGLREKAEALGVGDRVEFLGYIPDETLRELYGKSLALVQASSYEGFGLPVVEAMACGCPVLVAENSALTEVGAGAALFFPTGDVTALAGLMREVASDPVLRRDLSLKSLARARDFSWDKTASETRAAFADALAAAPVGARD